jgi:hypothetical protein
MYADPFDFVCDDCGAKAGERCVGVRRGKRAELPKPHAARAHLQIGPVVTIGHLVARSVKKLSNRT